MKAKRRAADPVEALGNPYRRDIMELLSRKPRSVQEIADRLPISRPAVSRHLSVLNAAGLVSDEQVGTRRVYRLERAELTQVWSEIATRFKLFAENTRPRKLLPRGPRELLAQPRSSRGS
jgi:DNA-binding transcriptional ArsR family regulator